MAKVLLSRGPILKKIILLLLTIFLLGQEDVRAEQKEKKENPNYFYFIGPIFENKPNSFYPSEYFIQEEGMVYQGYSHRVGGINLLFVNNSPKSINETVILEGYLRKDLTLHLKKMKEIAEEDFGAREHRIIQIKTEWLPPENFNQKKELISSIPGVTTRERLKNLKYYEVHNFKTINIFSTEKQAGGKQIKLNIQNPLDINLPQTYLQIRYEGGEGRPSPKFSHFNIAPIEKGKSYSILIDTVYVVEYTKFSKEKFFLSAAELTGRSDNFIINVRYNLD